MLYIGCDQEIPLIKNEYLTIEILSDDEKTVAQWFDTKHVNFVGPHTICSCGFPSVVAEVPIYYFDGMFDGNEHSEDDLNSIKELLKLLNTLKNGNSTVKLYPVWAGDEGIGPKGTIDLNLTGLNPNHFFFNERFMYIVSAEPAASPDTGGLAARSAG